MGIRIHKSIGYGLRGFKAPERFQERLDIAHGTTLAEFARWCRENSERILLYAPETDRGRRMMFSNVDLDPLNAKHFSQSLGRHIVYEGEFGFEDALLILPIAHDGWTRMDDTIDWAEEKLYMRREHLDGLDPRFENLDYGLYPHDQGKPPLTVAAALCWLGVPNLWPKLRESLYVYWA